MTILHEIAEYTKKRIEKQMQVLPEEELRKKAYALTPGDLRFEKALRKPELSFICECKKASPSKGVIAEEFPYRDIALAYEEAGADCISVLTEPKWFLGADEYAREIASLVKIPVIRKDFTIHPYMIYEAKVMGASAVLLIVSILQREELCRYLEICDELGLAALTETHDEREIETALSAGARIIGVNNRNLKDFSVDLNNSIRLREMVPADKIFVAESGIKTEADMIKLRDAGVNAVLIGETMMRADDKRGMIKRLKGI
jgi:indole-3-glycerol phosphate synthase